MAMDELVRETGSVFLKSAKEYESVFEARASGIKCELIYRIRENELSVTLENVCEECGFELIAVKFPVMVCIDEGKMVSVFGNGRLIDSNKSCPWGYEQAYDVRNTALIYNDEVSLLMETPYLDDKLQ